MKKKLIIVAACSLPLLGMQAQQDSTLVRTLVVEHEYNPTILDATKINVLPKVEEPTAAKAGVEYATALRPLTGDNYESMSPLSRAWKEKKGNRGFVKAGYGSHGNVDFKAGYLWDITQTDRLEVAAHLNGMNGKLNGLTTPDWNSRFYDSGAKLNYQHRFSGVTLQVGGAFQSQVFNYMPGVEEETLRTISDKQHHTLGNFLVGVKSHNESLPVQFALEMGYNYFDKKYAPFGDAKMAEKEFYTKGDVWAPINDEQKVGVAVQLNSYNYGVPQQEDFLSVQLNPYYGLENDSWKLRLGAHVDWQNRNESGLKIAPDVKVDYIFSDSYVLYLHAEGGRVLNNFRQLHSITPYWNTHSTILSSYVPLNASIGFKASPINNLWFNLFGGYRICENDLAGVVAEGELMSTRFLQEKSKVAYGGAELKYSYKGRADMGLKGTVYSWKVDGDNSALFLASKPEMEWNAHLSVRIIKPLELKVSYDYIKRAASSFPIVTTDLFAHFSNSAATNSNHATLGNVSNLSLGATYTICNGISAFVEVRNLLNTTYYLDSLYPAQGVNFLGGLSFQF